MQNHFEIFELPVKFEIDKQVLDAAFTAFQAKNHPDRIADSRLKMQAMQKLVTANTAYQTLKDDWLRGKHILELSGYPLDNETTYNQALLMQTLEQRETLVEAETESEIASLKTQVQQQKHQAATEFANHIDGANFDAAKDALLVLRYADKFLLEIKRKSV